MAKRGLVMMSLLSKTILLILVLTNPVYLAFASTRGPFGLRGNIQADATPTTMCSAASVVHSYNCQEYTVTTDDGYILSLQRFPEGRRGGGGGKNKQPVLLQHGVLVDGMTWLLNSPEESLALILADNDYDVWIANTRGTRFSRRHVSLDPSDTEFWNWTWDELVTHDLATVIGFVYNQTGQKLHYVGHSLGTLVALASFSEGKQVDKVKSAVMLSPIAYLSHLTTTLAKLAAKAFLGEITKVLGLAEFNPKGEPVGQFIKILCTDPEVDCYDLISAVTGKNCCLNSSTIDVFLKNEPQSTATKNLVHLSQTIRDGKLAKYDFGSSSSNKEHYGVPDPPVYNLTNIPRDLPLFLSYGGLDDLSDVKDVQSLLDDLKMHDTDKLTVQYVKDYAHADFILGVTAKDIVYNQVMAFFKQHQ